MKNKHLSVLLAVLMLGGLCGCSLARADAGAANTPDRLVGALITTEYLDLFDMDAYISDHADQFLSGGDIMIDSAGYEGRLYADVERSGNDPGDDLSASFPGTDGICFFSAYTATEDGMGSWSLFGSGVNDRKTEISVTDEGEEITLDGTIYLTPEAAGDSMCLYVNPVYQTDSGEFYAVSGQGLGFDDAGMEGEVFSTTLREETTLTKNGEKSSFSSAVTVRLSILREPVRITLFQMDANHRILREDSYTPGTLPERLSAEPKTAYILIETESQAPDGSVSWKREIFDDHGEEASFSTFYPLENGMLGKQETTVFWTSTQASPDPLPPV